MIQISDTAQTHFRKLIEREGAPGMGVRLSAVHPGTPRADARLEFAEPSDLHGDEWAVDCDGFTLYVDAGSVGWLDGAEIDIVAGAAGAQQLTIKAPRIKGEAPGDAASLVERVHWVVENEINPQLAARIGIEELSRDSHYDWVIFGLGPAPRTEILNKGKWHQIWPGHHTNEDLDRIHIEFWHEWNDVQVTMLLVLQFLSFVNLIGSKLYITGLSLHPNHYATQLSWIQNYTNDFDFKKLGVPFHELSSIGVRDFDRKLQSLRAMHELILSYQPDYLYDVPADYLRSDHVIQKHGKDLWSPGLHPNDLGYDVLADYFARKIGLCDTVDP